jgi:hypothetical protein
MLREKVIVICFSMTNMRSNREQHCSFIKALCCRRTTDASTVFAASVFGYLHLSFSRTRREEFANPFGKLFHVTFVRLGLSLSLSMSAALSGVSIGHAFSFRLIQGLLFNQ